jgi:hypothetical protein
VLTLVEHTVCPSLAVDPNPNPNPSP